MRGFFISLVAATGTVALTSVAAAITLTNSDAEQQTVVVTENGKRSEVALPPNVDISVCTKGCFISFPSGDMLPFKGSEKVVLESGKARIVAK